MLSSVTTGGESGILLPPTCYLPSFQAHRTHNLFDYEFYMHIATFSQSLLPLLLNTRFSRFSVSLVSPPNVPKDRTASLISAGN